MSTRPNRWMELLADAVMDVLPAVPYAAREHSPCGGLAVHAQGLAASANLRSAPAFTDAAFDIPCGCRAALIGPNGAGKSTLLRVLAGLLPARAGEVTVLGEAPRLGRSRIAYLAQRPTLAERFPIRLRRLVETGTYAHHGWFSECHHADAAVDRALARMGLTELGERPVHSLSGGQLQRGLIARAIVQGAELLLLDEPFAALDQASRAIVEEFLFAPDPSFTVVMATHDPADSRRFDRILELRDGRVRTVHACGGHEHRHA